MPVKLLDYEQDVLLRVLLYGDPGSGKSWFAGSAHRDPRTGPALHLDMGGNAFSMRPWSNKDRPPVVSMERLEDINIVFDWLRKRQPADHAFVRETGLKPGFKTVIFDGITGFQRLSFQKVTGAETKGLGDVPPTFEWPHYNAVLGQMTRFAAHFYTLPMHVIVTALEREKTDPNSSVTQYAPMLLGQSAKEVAGYAFAVIRMVPRLRLNPAMRKAVDEAAARDGEEAVSVALLRRDPSYVAKDQHGIGKAAMINPTITEVLDAMGVK